VLIAGGLYLTVQWGARRGGPREPGMSGAEARAVMGFSAEADAAAIQAAWRRLMARAHPDQGGTEGLAARLNAARDRLLRK
ncbi:MAG: molecular chaperone DnaJ, partial [Brevundimonas sp.]